VSGGEKRETHRVLLSDAVGGTLPWLDRIAEYLGRVRGVEAVAVGSVLSHLVSAGEKEVDPQGGRRAQEERLAAELARALARTRVHDPASRTSFQDPLPAELRFLQRKLTGRGGAAFGNLYEGMAAMSAFRALLRPGEELHIIFTDQILVTWDEDDLRYHARVLVAGCPALISIPGVVVAPARPREYYACRQAAAAAGASGEQVEEKMREVLGDRYVVHGDERIPEILKGYALQAVAYWFFGERFCEDPDCRLRNAHWQEEMLRAQLGGEYELCGRHAGMMGFTRNG